MAGKPLIGGTAYDITGGKTLVEGAAYSISGGKTLVDGTEYDISFAAIIPLPAAGEYLTFSSPNPFTVATSNATKNWDGMLEYYDETGHWATWDGIGAIHSITTELGEAVFIRGSVNTVITGNAAAKKWVIDGSNVSCIGNIESLLDYGVVERGDHPSMGNHCYAYMFYGCTSLTRSPSLPATMLADYCYYYMFYNCTSLCAIPSLPATTLRQFCYRQMFYGCSKVRLSATATGEYLLSATYRIPTSGTGTTDNYALTYMFRNTGGTFTGTPAINTTYYLSNTNSTV